MVVLASTNRRLQKQSPESPRVIRARLAQLRNKQLALDELIQSLERYLRVCEPLSEELEITRSQYWSHWACIDRGIRPERNDGSFSPLAPAPIGRKLLILDTESEARAALAAGLRALGYQIQVSGYDQAAATVAQSHPDLIVWHYRHADPAALGVPGELRALPFYPPLLAVSEVEDPGQTATLLACGCDGFLTSLKDVLQLKSWVEALLRRRDLYHRAETFATRHP